MISDRDSSGVLTRKEREELVLDLYFKENKTYHEIAKIARMSPRDIKPIIDKAYQEKERTEHKSTAVQAYELFYKGKTPLEVAITLNIGETQVTAYYWQYLVWSIIDNYLRGILCFKRFLLNQNMLPRICRLLTAHFEEATEHIQVIVNLTEHGFRYKNFVALSVAMEEHYYHDRHQRYRHWPRQRYHHFQQKNIECYAVWILFVVLDLLLAVMLIVR
jgi:hypothetical protein